MRNPEYVLLRIFEIYKINQVKNLIVWIQYLCNIYDSTFCSWLVGAGCGFLLDFIQANQCWRN